MSKRFLKITGLLTATVVLISSMTGCGGTKAESKAKATPAATAAASAEPEKPVTLEWLAYTPMAQPDSNTDVVKQLDKKFNVKFNFWVVDTNKYTDMLNLKFASGEKPDVFYMKDLSLPKLINQGIIKELPIDTLKQKAPNYMKSIEKNDADGMAFMKTTQDGKNYGFSVINVNSLYPTSLAWNKTWLKNVGIEKVPESIKEFEDALYKFTKNDPDKNGKNDTYGMSNMAMVAAFGAFGPIPIDNFRGNPIPNYLYFTPKGGKVTINAIQPEMKEALATISKWYKDGVIDPEFITGENKGGNWTHSQAFFNGRTGVVGTAMFYHYAPPLSEGDKGGVFYQELAKVKPDTKYDETFVVGKAPVGPKGFSGSNQWPYLTETFMISTNVDKEPKKLDKILQILDAGFADKELAYLTSFGIKDTDYKVDKDGNVGTALVGADLTKKGIRVFNFLAEPPDVAKEAFKAKFAFADKTKGTGYVALPAPQVDSWTKNGSTLCKLTLETYIAIITGTKPVDYFDEYVKQFRANGGDQLEKEYTDAWKASGGKFK